ncbi:MAG: hypothetical protein HYW50_00515 [Candidatus Diapherotrites archaeon]|nr:hypothetical protein [Candidatus Diapherotrites archaeon]
MSTTIQVEKPTKELLNNLKTNYNSKTYDAVIITLVRKKEPSMYAKLSKGKKVSVKEMVNSLRDKSDRL